MNRLTLSSNYNSSERNLFSDSICVEFILAIDRFGFDSFLKDSRAKAAATKTRCHVELTPRILNKRVSSSRWAKYAIVRITGPDQQSMDQCLRLLERQFPIFLHRKEYFRKADVTLFTNEVTLPDNIPGATKMIRSASTMSCCQGLWVKSPFSNDEVRPLDKTFWKIGSGDIEGRYTSCYLRAVEGQPALEETYSRLVSAPTDKFSKNEIFGAVGSLSKATDTYGNSDDNLKVRAADDFTEKEAKSSQTKGDSLRYANESLLRTIPPKPAKESQMSVKYSSNRGSVDIDVKSSQTSSSKINDTRESNTAKGILVNKAKPKNDLEINTKDSYVSSGIIKFPRESNLLKIHSPDLTKNNIENKQSPTSFKKRKVVTDDLSVKVNEKDGHFDVSIESSTSTESVHYTNNMSLNSTTDQLNHEGFKGKKSNDTQSLGLKKMSGSDTNVSKVSSKYRKKDDNRINKENYGKSSQESTNKIKSYNEPPFKSGQSDNDTERKTALVNTVMKSSQASSMESTRNDFQVKVGSMNLEIKHSKIVSNDRSKDGLFHVFDKNVESKDLRDSSVLKNLSSTSGSRKLDTAESRVSSRKIKHGKESDVQTAASSSRLTYSPVTPACSKFDRHQDSSEYMNAPIQSRRRIRSQSSKSVIQKPIGCNKILGQKSYYNDFSILENSKNKTDETDASKNADDANHHQYRDTITIKNVIHSGETHSLKAIEEESVDMNNPQTLKLEISTRSSTSSMHHNSSTSSTITIVSERIIPKKALSKVESIKNIIPDNKRHNVTSEHSQSESNSLTISIIINNASETKHSEEKEAKVSDIPFNSEMTSFTLREERPNKISVTSTLTRNIPETIPTPKLQQSKHSSHNRDSEMNQDQKSFRFSSDKGTSTVKINIQKQEENEDIQKESAHHTFSAKQKLLQKKESSKSHERKHSPQNRVSEIDNIRKLFIDRETSTVSISIQQIEENEHRVTKNEQNPSSPKKKLSHRVDSPTSHDTKRSSTNVEKIKSFAPDVESNTLSIKIQTLEEKEPDPISSVVEINRSNISSEGIVHNSDPPQEEMKFKYMENDDSSGTIKITITESKVLGKSETKDSIAKKLEDSNVQRVSGIKIGIVRSQNAIEVPTGVYLKGINDSSSEMKRIECNDKNFEDSTVKYISEKLLKPTEGILILMFEGLNIFSTGSRSVAIRPSDCDPENGVYTFESSHYVIKTKSRQTVFDS